MHNKFHAKSVIRGIVPPLVTPFREDEEMDEMALRNEARYLINAGVHGLSLGGSTGEGALLSDDELVRGLGILCEENTKSLPLVCGIIRNSTRDAIRAGIAAREAGANALMVTPTFYHGTNRCGNVSYYQEISTAVGRPIIIYNVIAGNPISPELMRELCEIEGIAGIKQSVGGLHGLNEMLAACADRTAVYGAQDDLLFCSYALGVAGAISAILTAFPCECVAQWEAAAKGDWDLAKKIHWRLLPVWRLVGNAGMGFPGKLKALLRLMGRSAGMPRRPILDPDAREIQAIQRALMEAGFLPDQNSSSLLGPNCGEPA